MSSCRNDGLANDVGQDGGKPVGRIANLVESDQEAEKVGYIQLRIYQVVKGHVRAACGESYFEVEGVEPPCERLARKKLFVVELPTFWNIEFGVFFDMEQ